MEIIGTRQHHRVSKENKTKLLDLFVKTLATISWFGLKIVAFIVTFSLCKLSARIAKPKIILGVVFGWRLIFFFFFFLPSSNRITHSAESAVTNAGSWQQYTKYL